MNKCANIGNMRKEVEGELLELWGETVMENEGFTRTPLFCSKYKIYRLYRLQLNLILEVT